MKIRNTDREAEKIKLEMTPMIDVVFQLLVFFILTYKVTAMEGDFGIKMPLASDEVESMTDPLSETVYIRLEPDENRNLAAVSVEFAGNTDRFEIDANPDAVFKSIQNIAIGVAAGGGDPAGGNEIEAEIDADYDLRYAETIRVIEAISGYRDENEQIVKLIEKIKFKDSGP